MAKKSFSSRKSFRSLFSKSEANLKESVEKEDSGKGTLKLFTWKKKKKPESSGEAARTESGDGDGQDGETKRKTSLFGSILKSKKGLLSYSETDLHKPKGFAASLSWKKKKKKKRDLSQSLSSNSEVSGVKDYISEEEEYDHQVEVEQNQLDSEAATPMTEPPFTSDQSQTEDVLSDMSGPNEKDAGFMPSDLNSTSIPYIDSSLSDSDVYQTPPDSPVPEFCNTRTADRSSQSSTYELSFTSQAEPDITDSFSPVPNIKTDPSTAHSSSADLNPNYVSGKDDHLFSNFNFEASKSGFLADVEVKTITTDIAQKESYREPKNLKDAPDAVHQNRISSIDQSSISSTSESPISSIPQKSISSISESPISSIPQKSISSISESPITSIPQKSISSISESPISSIPQKSISSISESPISSIPQKSISSISESPITSIPQKSISSISESSISSIPQKSISSISESPISSIPQKSISSISESSISSIPQKSISSISESSISSIPQKSISSISESSITSIPQKSISSISESSISSIPQKSISSISESSISSIPQKSISSISESPISSIPQKSISSISESSITSIPQKSISSISESSISSIPQKSISSISESPISSIPQKSISSISESPISSIPQKSISSISESPISSIPQKSISSISESSISSIPQKSISSISESSISSIPQKSISSISESPITSIPQKSISSISESSISSIPQKSISSISESSISSIPQKSISSISESPISSIPQKSISSISESSISSIPQKSISSISESSISSIPQKSISSISESSITSIPQKSISSISESSISSIPQKSISSISESPISSIPQKSISSISESSISSIPQKSISSISESPITSIPQKSISSISESSISSIPQKSISSISESPISSIPQKSISSISESSITSIPQKSISSISESSISSIPQKSISSISESPITSIPQKSISSISESPITSIPQKSISSISESPITSIPQKSISSISESPITSIPQKSISSISESSISSIPQKSISSISESPISSIPQKSISSISESSISSIPQKSISSISESSISSIPQKSISSISESPITSIPQKSISSISESPISSIPQKSISSISESPITSIPQKSISSISESPITSIPQKSISSISESPITSIPQKSISSISESPISSIPQKSISSISESSITSIPQKSISSISESPISSIPQKSISSISESPISSIPQKSISSITMHSTSDSSFLEETHPAINCETISMESHRTDNYSSSTFAADSVKPAEPVLLEDELNIALPQSVASQKYTIIKTVTFDLSGPSDPISPEHSQKGLFNNMSYSDVETLTETSAECQVSLDKDQAKFAKSSETASDFQDSCVSSTLTSETIPAIIIHPHLHLGGSYQLFSTQSPKEERDKQLKDCEEDVQEASTQSSELIGQDETIAESMTTRNDLQMSVKNKYGPEVEDGSRLDPDFHYKCHVKSIQEPESIEILTAAESMTTRNDLQISVKNKYGPEVEDGSRLDPDFHYKCHVKSIQEPQSIEILNTAESMTTRNDFQMSVKNKYGPEVEDGSRLDPDFHYKCHVKSIQEPESIAIITAAESMTSRNDPHTFVKEKYGRDVEEQRDIYDEHYDVSLNQERDTEAEQIINEQILLHKVSEKYEVEELNDESQVVQSPREASATQGVMEAEVCVLTGQAEPQILGLAPLKPALPVNQECGSEECTWAPPFSEVSLADWSMQTHSHLEIRLRPLAPHLSSAEIAILQDTAKCKHQTHTDNSPAEREEHTGTVLSKTPESESQDHSTGKIFTHSIQTELETNRENISVRNGLRVSESTPEKDDTGSDQLLSRSLIPAERFFHASSVLSTVIEESETEAETEPGSDTDMNSSVAVFSTKLSRPSSAREGRDEAMKVRKVSLVQQENHESPLDRFRDQEEPSRASPELERRWKSLHSHSEEPQSSSDYLRSSRSPSYEKGVYTSHFHSAQPSAFSLETDWKVLESEVHGRSESYAGGRIRAELGSPEEREGEREQVRRQTVFDKAQYDSSLRIVETDDYSSDVFQATRVELIPSPTGDALSPSSFSEMDNFVDTLKSMERPVRQRLQRTPSNTPFSSLPPIEEDAPISPRTPLSPLTPASPVYEPKTLLNGFSSLPADIGLHWSSPKDMRSPLTMMKEQQFGDSPSRGISLPMRASALNSIVMRRGSLNDLASPEETPAKGNGNGSSRLENSFFFQPTENGNSSSRSIFRAASLPEISPGPERMSSSAKTSENLLASRFERFSFLTSPSNSLSGFAESSRISVAPPLQETSSFDHKSTSDLYRSLPSETLLKNSLPRSSSLDGGFLINESFQKPEPERNVVPKYRAFPDAYLTKEKEHGKLNPRPGKMLIYDKPGMSGERIEVRGDVVDATPWEFTDTISVRVIRGGWVLYEKPEFKGEKFALDEGDIELNDPFGPPHEEDVSGQQEGTTADRGDVELKPRIKRRFVIGSIRRAVRDYSVPEISLFPEENAEGKKVTFRDTSEDSRIFGFPIKANSIIINAGLWLVFAEPFFQGVPRVLEVGGFSSPAAWGVTHPYVASLHPLKIGEPRVENLYEPKIVLYEKPYFTGKSREIYSSMRDFLSRVDKQQSLFMFSAGSIKVLGGCWVGYEKEGFRGYQYLLEEGEYHDWRVWGGVNSELRSLRVIQADLSEPLLVLYGMPEEEKQEEEDEHSFEVTEAVADVELFGFGINTRSIHVLSGAWIAYSHVDFSGNQYVLEKGFYNNCSDWGSEDNRICSIQPILAAPGEGPSFRNEVLLYSDLDFQGSCRVCHQNQSGLPESLAVRSCRVVGGSWVLYGGEKFTGDMCVLSEGDYPNLTSMGFPSDSSIRSVKAVPMTFSVPSISLFGLECFEGREVVIDTQVSSMQEEGFNTHFLSVRVSSGCWVLCEHSNYRGRQFLLEPIEITNWQKFSCVSCIGSLYPVRQKQRLFRIRNRESGHCVSVQGGVEDMKTGRVVVSEQVEGMSDLWLYQDGLIKNKLARSMSLQVMGNVESGAKVVLWTETRMPVQMWSAEVKGRIRSITFPGMLLDIKGGKTYDREHVVIREESEESLSQQWELEFL